MDRGMSGKKTIRKKLQGSNSFNPFNREFDVDKLKRYIEQAELKSDDDKYAKTIAESAEIYNYYYNEYVEVIKKAIEKENISIVDVVETVFGMANLDYIQLSKQAMENRQNKSLFDFAHLELDNSEQSFGTINIVGAVEGQVDYINTILNIIRHIVPNEKVGMGKDKLRIVHRMYVIANILYYIKESYDVALWEDGYIDKRNNELHVKYIDGEYPLAKHIGYIRTENNIGGSLSAVECLSNMDIFHKEYFLTGRSDYIIENAELDEQGYIQYSLVKKENNYEEDMPYVLGRTEVDLYYPFIYNEKIETLNGLSINDMIILFSKLSKLMEKIEHFKTDKYKNCSLVLVKIEKKEMVRFLKQTTVYCKKQIEAFLEINTNRIDNVHRINLRERPLLLLDNTFLCLMSAIAAPNYSYLTDVWLDAAGVDLTQRGKNFEKYIKKSLEETLEKKGYMHYVSQTNKFTNYQGDFEEIDLVLNLKNTVILAEVKCITYAMECRNTHNNMKIIKKAADQIKRKANFIDMYKKELANDIGNIEDKKNIKVIITNYPIFAGTKVEDVPIVDFYLFDSYFRSGKLTNVALTADGKRSKVEISYYSDENEMCEKIEKFIENPPSIEVIRKKLKLEERQLTFPKSEIQIFQEFPSVCIED